MKKRPYILRLLLTGAFILLLVSILLWRLLAFGPSSGSSIGMKPTRIHVSPAPQLHVTGNQLFDAHNQAIRLIGANRSGTEYQCLHDGVFDGPSDQSSIDAMLQWHIN